MLKTMLKATLAGALLLSTASAQRDMSSVEIRAEAVTDGIYVLYGAGGNMGLFTGTDAIFLVDDQFAPLTPKILAKVKELTGAAPHFVLNTHYHGDHTGGNENLGKAGAVIFSHDNVRKRVIQDNEKPENAPVVTFPDSQTFHINGDTVRAYHVHNAHTDGDSFVYWEMANVIHTGDLMFEKSMGSFPFIDLKGGGSVNGAIKAMDRMIDIADRRTKVIPGHGQVTDRAGLIAYRGMLVDVRNKVQSMMQDGMSRKQIVEARPARSYARGRENGFIKEDQFVNTVIDSLSAE
ncbi:MBL fold metallo-hydrolase [Parvularcula sp. ZS-1/3]|uniref:beta-lactamase n=1 Tax=Parvularcula mediterranea TaxID=2732508 RepID=A0A7Y3RMP4_9PROT|nr:MBL fold metallo-hydrolase [Parvularcula mediterranea]NNU16921.1 MBL fold metallo-hydrolase [Parvularcula mediterranea]